MINFDKFDQNSNRKRNVAFEAIDKLSIARVESFFRRE